MESFTYKRTQNSGGSRISRRGGMDPRGGYVTKILYVKTKEFGPVGGRAPGTPPLNPPMQNTSNKYIYIIYVKHTTNTHTHTHDILM